MEFLLTKVYSELLCNISFVRDEYKDRTINNAVTEMGNHLTFDITELFSSKVNIQQETLTFAVRCAEHCC